MELVLGALHWDCAGSFWLIVATAHSQYSAPGAIARYDVSSKVKVTEDDFDSIFVFEALTTPADAPTSV
jgi:hypothetical protein